MSPTQPLNPTIDQGDRSDSRRAFLAVFVPLAALYLLTATWAPPYDADTLTNALTAQEIGTRGDVFLDRHEQLVAKDLQGIVSWVVPARETAAAQYPPGAAILAAPLYAVWPGEGVRWRRVVFGESVEYQVPPIAPAAIAAGLAVALGVALLGLAFREIVDPRTAILGAYALGLATGVWSVAADKLWLHSAGVLYLSAAMWLSASRYLSAGVGFGLAVLTRPHTAIIGAATAIGRGVDKRSTRPVLQIGAGIGAGVVVLLLFNYAVFGRVSISGGYNLDVGQYLGSNGLNLLANIWGGFFDLSRGLFPLSPFLLVLLPGVPRAWRVAPNWVRAAALGGLSYYLVQLSLNRFSGGSGFWGYRYPIEMLVAAGPLMLLAYQEWVAPRRRVLRIFIVALAISIGIHAAGALRCAQYVC